MSNVLNTTAYVGFSVLFVCLSVFLRWAELAFSGGFMTTVPFPLPSSFSFPFSFPDSPGPGTQCGVTGTQHPCNSSVLPPALPSAAVGHLGEGTQGQEASGQCAVFPHSGLFFSPGAQGCSSD